MSHKHSVLQTLLACTLLKCIEPQPGNKQSFCVKLAPLTDLPPLLLIFLKKQISLASLKFESERQKWKAFSSYVGGDNRQVFSKRLALVLQALLLARIEAQMAGNKELASGLLIPAALQDEAVRCTPHHSLPPLLSFCAQQPYIVRHILCGLI